MKTMLVLGLAALFGFAGGIVGQRICSQSMNAAVTSSVVRATSFQLVDNTGRVLSTWGVDDKHGRIAIWFNDENGHPRAFFGNEAGERPSENTWAGYKPIVEFEQPDGDEPLLLGVDRWGPPHLVMGDANWHGRIAVGPLDESDVVSDRPPDPNGPWGVSFHTLSGARASIGTTMPSSKRATGFIVLSDGERSWGRVAGGVR